MIQFLLGAAITAIILLFNAFFFRMAERQEKHSNMENNGNDKIEALRTEYEKGRHDVIENTISWLSNVWPRYCDSPNIIDDYKEAMKE